MAPEFLTIRICGAGCAESMRCKAYRKAIRWIIAGKGILAGRGTMIQDILGAII